ncbi:MAG: sigma-70 family RNA polymerase sigma factor [Lentisphaeraceae bacterium]|nr:sigma-70 family RNA polymerase sigma factor [Lentisphaeraceae bacterium]
MRKAQSGCLIAYEEIVNLHIARIRSFVAYSLPFDDAIHDITQETFILAHERLAQFTEGNFAAWLKALARNLVRKELTRLKRKKHNRDNYEKWFFIENNAEEDIEPLHIDSLETCLKKLKYPHKKLLGLRYTDAYNSREIADYLQKSHSWVRTTLKRVRQSLKQCLQETGEI